MTNEVDDILKKYKKSPDISDQEVEDTEGMTLIETLSTNQNYKTIKSYMSDRFGMEEDKYSKREIIDSYINQMRKFNSGQSVVTVSELAHLNAGEGDSLARRRSTAATTATSSRAFSFTSTSIGLFFIIYCLNLKGFSFLGFF